MESNAEYLKIIQNIRDLLLDPSELRRSNLSNIITRAFESLPSVNEKDSYLGQPLQTEPDLSEWDILPENGHDRWKVLDASLKAIYGQPRWHSPTVMHNVNPPPLLDTIAASAVVNTYNPNLLWDFISAGGQSLERQILRQMGRLAGWNETQPEGAFTFGGKGCLIYAIRIGLNRCIPNISSEGLSKGLKPVVIASTASHYSIETVCSLLGIGRNAWTKIPTLSDGTISLENYRIILRDAMAKGKPIACIIASGGDTLNMASDSPVEMRRIADEEAAFAGLKYKPFLYFDTAVGWPWMTYKDYHWESNPLDIPDALKEKLKTLGNKLGETQVCDAFGLDFHKLGFAPYQSSAFVIRNAAEFHSIYKDMREELPREAHGNNFVQHHTLEHSRSLAPIISAWISLQNIGINGFRSYLAYMTEIGSVFQKELPKYDIEHVNPHGLGFAGIFWPRRKDGPKTYAEFINADAEIVQSGNEFTFALYGQLSNPVNEQRSIVLRYLPQYRMSKTGLPAATLVVYPMAVATTIELALDLAHQIGQKAQELQNSRTFFSNLNYEAPKHVPK